MQIEAKIIPTVPMKYRRSAVLDQRQSVDLARQLINDMADALGVNDFGNIDLLDVGCGVRYTQAFLTYGLPLKSYTGVDTFHEMLDFLRSKVDDPRFTYCNFQAHNDLYAPTEVAMTENSDLGLGGRQFDVICAQSLFTHFNPNDFEIMLKIMRKAIKPDGRLLFSAFLNEPSATGFGYVDNWLKKLTPAQAAKAQATPRGAQPKFSDAIPDKPLLVAVFRRDYAIELVQNAGWHVIDIREPQPFIQHQFVCKPAE